MYADEEKILAAENKFELSEEHHVMEDVNNIVEMESFLRERVTTVTVTESRESNSDFESQTPYSPDSNEESSGDDATIEEIYENTNEESEQTLSQSSVKISREGMRKQKKTAACTMPNSYRQRKSDDQVKILSELYHKHNGKLSRKVRKEAMAKTGLAWIQIYKWFFDRQLKKSAIEKACCT